MTWIAQVTADPPLTTYPGLLKSVAWGGGGFVAVGDETTLSSTNGVAWYRGEIIAEGPINTSLRKVIYGGGTFVAMGDHPDLMVSGTEAGPTYWERANTGLQLYCEHIGPGVWSCTPEIDAMVWAGTQFQVYGGEEIREEVSEECVQEFGDDPRCIEVFYEPRLLTSTNGRSWTKRPIPTWFKPAALIWNGKQFLGVGQEIWTSLDGTTWTTQIAGITGQLNDVARGANQFVAVGNKGLILTSWDGARWRRRPSGVRLIFSASRLTGAVSWPWAQNKQSCSRATCRTINPSSRR